MVPNGASAEVGPQAAAQATIHANQGWQSTGVQVGANSRFRITYNSGAWTVDHRNFPNVGPNGYSDDIDRKIYQPCKPYPEHPYGYLMRTITNSQRSHELHVGDGGDWMAPISGTLALTINDKSECHGDNAGSVSVTVTPY